MPVAIGSLGNRMDSRKRTIQMNLKEILDKHSDEYLKFQRVENKRSNRPDIHAFLLLDEIIPGDESIVSGAEHDEIFLSVDLDILANAATEEQILELIRCGVRLDSQYGILAMFV